MKSRIIFVVGALSLLALSIQPALADNNPPYQLLRQGSYVPNPDKNAPNLATSVTGTNYINLQNAQSIGQYPGPAARVIQGNPFMDLGPYLPVSADCSQAFLSGADGNPISGLVGGSLDAEKNNPFNSQTPGSANNLNNSAGFALQLLGPNAAGSKYNLCKVFVANDLLSTTVSALYSNANCNSLNPSKPGAQDGTIDCALKLNNADGNGASVVFHVQIDNPNVYSQTLAQFSTALLTPDSSGRNTTAQDYLTVTATPDDFTQPTGIVWTRDIFNTASTSSVNVAYTFDATPVCGLTGKPDANGNQDSQCVPFGDASSFPLNQQSPIAYLTGVGQVYYLHKSNSTPDSTTGKTVQSTVADSKLGTFKIDCTGAVTPGGKAGQCWLSAQGLQEGVYQVNLKAFNQSTTTNPDDVAYETIYINVSPKNTPLAQWQNPTAIINPNYSVLTYPGVGTNWTGVYANSDLDGSAATASADAYATYKKQWGDFAAFLSGKDGSRFQSNMQQSNVRVIYDGRNTSMQYTNLYNPSLVNGASWPADENGLPVSIWSTNATPTEDNKGSINVGPVQFSVTADNLGLENLSPTEQPANASGYFLDAAKAVANGSGNTIAFIPAVTFSNPMGAQIPTYNPEQMRQLSDFLAWTAVQNNFGGISIDAEMPNLPITPPSIADFWKMLADKLAYKGKTLSIYQMPNSMITPAVTKALGPLGYYLISTYDVDNDFTRMGTQFASLGRANQSTIWTAIQQDNVCTDSASGRYAPNSWCNASFIDDYLAFTPGGSGMWTAPLSEMQPPMPSPQYTIANFGGQYQPVLPLANSATSNGSVSLWNPILEPTQDAGGNWLNPGFLMARKSVTITSAKSGPVTVPCSFVMDLKNNPSPVFPTGWPNGWVLGQATNLIGMLGAGDNVNQADQVTVCNTLFPAGSFPRYCDLAKNSLNTQVAGALPYSRGGDRFPNTVAYEAARACLFEGYYSDGASNTYNDYFVDSNGKFIPNGDKANQPNPNDAPYGTTKFFGNIAVQNIMGCMMTDSNSDIEYIPLTTGLPQSATDYANLYKLCIRVSGLPSAVQNVPADSPFFTAPWSGATIPTVNSDNSATTVIPAAANNYYNSQMFYWWTMLGALNETGQATPYADSHRIGFALYQLATLSETGCTVNPTTGKYGTTPNCRMPDPSFAGPIGLAPTLTSGTIPPQSQNWPNNGNADVWLLDPQYNEDTAYYLWYNYSQFLTLFGNASSN